MASAANVSWTPRRRQREYDQRIHQHPNQDDVPSNAHECPMIWIAVAVVVLVFALVWIFLRQLDRMSDE